MTPRWAVAGASVATLLLAISAPLVQADEREIAIVDGGFEPSTLTVFTGEPVTWTNQTLVDHAVLTEDGLLNSGPIGPGEAFGHVFEKPGTVEYYESGNPRLRATIIVKAAPGTLAPDISSAPPTTEPPTPSGTSGGNSQTLFLAVAVVGAIAIGATIAALIGASRRPDR